MKVFAAIVQAAILLFVGLIAYNTGVGKTLPVHHPSWMACDGQLARALFYSTLLAQNESLKALSLKVKEASTLEQIDRLVLEGSNIDSRRTVWFESVSDPGKCQAQVVLGHPNEDGNNTAYIGYEITGFGDARMNWLESLQGHHVLQSINVDVLQARWFKT